MAEQPKGGFAAALIMLAIVGMFFMYMIMIYPEYREKLLRNNTTNITVNAPNVLFKDMNTYYIGNGKSAVTFNYKLSNFNLSYPLKDILMADSKLDMKANILTHDNWDYKISKDGNTKDFLLVLNISKIDGKLDISSNDKLIREIKTPGIYNIITNENVKFTFNHLGWAFWKTDVLNSNVKVYKEEYVNSGSIQVFKIPINEITGEYVGIKFNTTKYNQGNITISLNGKELYSGTPLKEMNIMGNINIVKNQNELKLIANKGANYEIDNLTFYLFSGSSPTLDKDYYFNAINQSVKVGVKVHIIVPGILSIQMLPNGTIYFINKDMVINNDWNWFDVDQKEIKNMRGIRVYSINGKFQINGFQIENR